MAKACLKGFVQDEHLLMHTSYHGWICPYFIRNPYVIMTPALVCWAIKTKHHRVGGNQVFSHHSGGSESKTQVPLLSLSPWLLRAPSCLFLPRSWLCAHIPHISVCPDLLTKTRVTSLGSTQMSNLSMTSLECLPSSNSHILMTGSWGFHMWIQGEGRRSSAQSSSHLQGQGDSYPIASPPHLVLHVLKKYKGQEGKEKMLYILY